MLATLLPLAADAAEEGKKIIVAMLVIGLIFVAVVGLGETARFMRTRRGGDH